MTQTADKIISVLYLGLGGEAGHESSSGIAGIVLLDETDCGVDDEQSDDPHKVLPVRWLPLKNQQNTSNPLNPQFLHDTHCENQRLLLRWRARWP